MQDPSISIEDWNALTPEQKLAGAERIGAMTDATSTNLTSFAAKGGKMLIVTGWSDPIFSAADLIDWYDGLTTDSEKNGAGDAKRYARLFLTPGMNHCGGGDGPSDFDALQTLVDWVEDGTSPDDMPAKRSGQDEIIPLCAYPAKTYGVADARGTPAYACR